MGYLEHMDTLLTTASVREQKMFVRTFVGSYTVYPDRHEAQVGFYRIPQHDRMKDVLELLPTTTEESRRFSSTPFPSVTPAWLNGRAAHS